MREFIISEKTESRKLHRFLEKILKNAQPSFIYRMLRKKNIVLNDKKADGSEVLRSGDSVKIYLSDETFEKFSGEDSKNSDAGLRKRGRKTDLYGTVSVHQDDADLPEWFIPGIVYEDDDIIAVNKPVDVLSQKAGKNDISLAEYINIYLRSEETADGGFTAGTANRLDRNTSGLVFAGKSIKGAHFLNDLFKKRDLRKIYTVLVYGHMDSSISEEAWLRKDRKRNMAAVSDEKHENAVRISTSFIPASFSEYKGYELTLVHAVLHTGKPHQIRAHLKKLGFPAVGDTKYGFENVNRVFSKDFRLRSQLLHAGTVVFGKGSDTPPVYRGKKIEAPLPEKFIYILKKTGFTENFRFTG